MGSGAEGSRPYPKGQQLWGVSRLWPRRKTSPVWPDLILQKLGPVFLLTFPHVETLANDSKNCKTSQANRNRSEGQV